METEIINSISTLVSNVGFPIAAFVAMYYMCNTTLKEVRSAIDDLSSSITQLLAKEGL